MSPRVDSKERRVEIIEAAMRCLLRSGYHRTSMDDIVAESGLSKGTIYWHFKNKKDLFLALFDYVVDQMTVEFGDQFEQASSSGEKLYLLLSSISLIAEENLNRVAIPLQFMIDLLHDRDFVNHYQNSITEVAEQTQKIIEQGIEDGEFQEVDAFETAWTLMAFFDGLLLYYVFDMPGDILKQSQIMADLVVSGLKKK